MKPPAHRFLPSRRLLLATALLVAAFVAVPYWLDEEERTLDQAIGDAPADIVELSMGVTHYRVDGTGPSVVLIHGFNGPMTTWRHTREVLAQAGFRVVSYDLYGRGHSARPEAVYDLDLFVTQLRELLAHLEIDRPLALVGSSFGCVVATAFSLRQPERVDRLALIGPAGFPGPSAKIVPLLGVPWLSDHLYRAAGGAVARRITRQYYVAPERFPEAHEDFRAQQRIEGFRRAALSTMRHSPLFDYEGGWRALGRSGLPVLLVWGVEDVSFPFEQHRAALDYIPQAELVAIEGAAHLPHYEAPERVNTRLVDFLGR